MKERITVTLDADILADVKQRAHREQKSVSKVVEDTLRRNSTPKKESFVDRFLREHGGKFKLRNDPNDARLQYLIKKYVKTRE